jgi:hypothetical protein
VKARAGTVLACDMWGANPHQPDALAACRQHSPAATGAQGQTPRPGRRGLLPSRWLCLRLVRPGSAWLVALTPSAGCGLTANVFSRRDRGADGSTAAASCPCPLSGTRRPPSRALTRVRPPHMSTSPVRRPPTESRRAARSRTNGCVKPALVAAVAPPHPTSRVALVERVRFGAAGAS